jgi:hypothetical protein
MWEGKTKSKIEKQTNTGSTNETFFFFFLFSSFFFNTKMNTLPFVMQLSKLILTGFFANGANYGIEKHGEGLVLLTCYKYIIKC